MGLLTTLRELWAGPLSAKALPEAPASVIPTKQDGVSGIANFGGQVFYEPIVELRGQAGYGRTGADWGFWEDLSAANSFVAAALDHICAPVADCRVDIEEIPEELIGSGPGKVTAANAEAMLELLRWNFTEKLQLQAHLAVSGRGFLKTGFSLFEPTAAMAPDGRWYCSKLSERLPLSLHTNPWIENDEHTTLKAVRQQSTRGYMSVSPELPAERLLLYIWQRQGTNWQGRSAFRAVQYIAGHVMPMLLKLIGVTLQREGAGIPVAVAADPQTPLDEDQRIKLVELMKSLVFHESANAVMPAGWELKWIFSGGSNKGHVLEVWRELGTVVLQQLGAQQIQLGTSNTGSRSVGEVHDARSAAKVKEVLKLQMAVLNGDDGEPFQGLGPRVCQWNFGVQAAYPRIKLVMQRPEMGPLELATAAKAGLDAGLLTPTLLDQNTLRERLSFPPLSQEDFDKLNGAGGATVLDGKQSTAAIDLMQRVVDGQLPPEAASQALMTFYNVAEERAVALLATLKSFKPEPKAVPPAFGQPVLPVPPGPPKPGEKAPPKLDEQPVKASAQRSAWQPWRALTAAEAKMNLPALDAYFTAQRDTFETQVRPLVLGMLAKAAPAIHAAMADGKVAPAEVAAIPLDTKRLAAFLADFIAKQRAAGAASVRAEVISSKLLTAAAEDEQDDLGKSEAEIAREEADEVTAAQADALTRKVLARLRGEVEREAVDALRTGTDAADVVDRVVSRQIDTGAFRSDAGSVTTKAFSVGRDEAARIMGGIASVTYTAILDNATCSACQADDGKTVAFDSAEHDELLPPNRDCSGGDNCRCLLIMNPAGPGEGDE